MDNSYILTRLNAIEHEVAEVRRRLERESRPARKMKSLFGVLGPVEFTEEEIEHLRAEK